MQTLSKQKKVICIVFFIIFFVSASGTDYYANTLIENTDHKIVYLTFDDGPSVITNNLLDALKACNVKATFFIVGKEVPGREKVLKRIHDEGHSIGLHTYSHNFKKIYKSENIFIQEMISSQEKIKEVTGYSSTFIRFPGGSSKHLSESMLEKIHDNNLKVFDWNSSLEDGVNPNLSVDDLVKNSKKCKAHSRRIILLMHCNSNNTNTIKALPRIIKYYKSCGYEIKPITDSTPEYYYKFKK